MEISEILDKNIIDTNLDAATKEEAIEHIVAALKANDYISDEKAFAKDIYAREKEGKTGIGNYIAIPHGRSSVVDKVGVAIFINKQEIPWESIDEHGVKVIVLFAVGDSNEGAEQHLKLLALFAKKLGNESVVENLLEAGTADDVIASFTQ
ncbi:fructose PTS transporter subunit IIA [Tetragenococcus halophilus]|uniref:Phosphotransferase system enzyme IIA component n=1 Tax=Tetragenococcus halophilus (strain DSM 20338 / JCM 20259 / NCIMB 9735 / NBRC 12172) TaxID=945021 RepID=A0AAN1SFC7_TETHN|nr:fructose PTS transporter subunit IIA [Tetragenococcus halophilus]NRR74935.1 PTS sugar transporter subunit IIA [Tetragenococcus halophilus]QXN86501.1 fructose PTS transporter subunit IIA [Tetragenococcus halophilus]RQD29417.1 PTS fructose transporter subunit IIA [Tetragenococcus halophilus subsp. halophilus DSM 20339]WJS81555.1 fructose PTS transporter subunit IIA [Tetragenococcus halophilus]BAK93940.1 phosphotransferase system enzyme IIA component [Tetragenococcus halophilus NBRC 12172]